MTTMWYNSVLGLFYALVISNFVPDLLARENKHYKQRLGFLIPNCHVPTKAVKRKYSLEESRSRLFRTKKIDLLPLQNDQKITTRYPVIVKYDTKS